jgi:hypothetical protein
MARYPEWCDDTEMLLAAAGWHAGRRMTTLVSQWRSRLSAFHMSAAAENALEEFGGICVQSAGPGLECAWGSFDLNPELAFGEEDRFAGFAPLAGGDLFPLGEVDAGHAFLGIDPVSRVYLIGDRIALEGNNIRAALDAILVGRMPKWLSG